MPVIRSTETQDYEVHGSTFRSYVAPARGGTQLCAWLLQVPADLVGQPHRPSREEVLLVLEGELRVTLDGEESAMQAGDVALVPAGSELKVDGGPAGARVWATTTPGLEAVLADGTKLSPPWAN